MIVATSTFNLRVLRELGKQLGLDLSVQEKDGAETLKVLQALFDGQEGILRHVSLSFVLVLDPMYTVEILTSIKGGLANLLIHQNGDILLITATLDDWLINLQRGSTIHSVLKFLNIVYNVLVAQDCGYLLKEFYKDKAPWPELFILRRK